MKFILSVPAATSGWVVQEVSHDTSITGGEHKQGHFWEGFYVEKGASTCIYFPVDPDGLPVGPDDTYREMDHPPNTTGVSTITGRAKFYEGTLPADFIRNDPADAQTTSGDRRSTKIQPPFWDWTGTDHNLTVTWDCTAGIDIKSMLPTPDPAGVCPKD